MTTLSYTHQTRKTPDAPPRGLPIVGLLPKMLKDPLEFFNGMSHEYGDVVPLKLGLQTIYLINHPRHFRHIYQENRDNYVRSKYYGQLSPIIGDGLFTLEGKAWRTQRQHSQPAFNGPNLMEMSAAMVGESKKFIARLKQFESQGESFDIIREAFNLKLQIVLKALLNINLDQKGFEKVLGSITVMLKEIEKRIWEIFPAPLWLPTARNKALKEAFQTLRHTIEEIVTNRLSEGNKDNDLLDMLVTAEQASGWDDNSLKSIVDQVISVVIAGHETGAISLCWLTYELSKQPKIAERIRLECDHVFGDRDPAFADFQKLQYTYRVFKEILRMYPPLWTVSREAVAEDYLGDFRIPKGAIVMLSPYVIQRNARFWKNPTVFDPDRFLPEEEEKRDKFSYLPFGGGPHLCLGNRFGALEGVLSLALLCKNFDFELVAGQKIKPAAMTTLRPAEEMFLKVHSIKTRMRRLAA